MRISCRGIPVICSFSLAVGSKFVMATFLSLAVSVISESESCYTTRTTNTSGSTSSALEEMQRRGSESEAEDQGADRCLTLPVRLKCETRVPRVFVR